MYITCYLDIQHRSLFNQNYIVLYMLCAKELGYLKFILHKHINTSLQQGLAPTRNSEKKSMQAINQNCYICIKKTAKNDVHVNIFALTICGLHISSFFLHLRIIYNFLKSTSVTLYIDTCQYLSCTSPQFT